MKTLISCLKKKTKKLVSESSHPALGRISTFDSCSFHLFNNVNYSHSAMSSFHQSKDFASHNELENAH